MARHTYTSWLMLSMPTVLASSSDLFVYDTLVVAVSGVVGRRGLIVPE
jgi:hypothetical protein